MRTIAYIVACILVGMTLVNVISFINVTGISFDWVPVAFSVTQPSITTACIIACFARIIELLEISNYGPENPVMKLQWRERAGDK